MVGWQTSVAVYVWVGGLKLIAVPIHRKERKRFSEKGTALTRHRTKGLPFTISVVRNQSIFYLFRKLFYHSCLR